MGQIANQMLVEAIFKLKEKIKKKAKKNITSATSDKKSKKEK